METLIRTMLKRYDVGKANQENAVKEILQEIALSGLSRGGFFQKAVFYGGTCLRIFYGLDRFSEDLDFSLRKKDLSFGFGEYIPFILNELRACGLNGSIEQKEKTYSSDIKKVFLKFNRNEAMSTFFGDEFKPGNKEASIKIKIEVDANPPSGATYEEKSAILPYPCTISTYDTPSQFASKIHAVISRNWGSRIKGRDLFDYLYYVGLNTKINKELLKEKLLRSGEIKEGDIFDISILENMLIKRFDSLDYEEAKADVSPFISDARYIENWKKDIFIDTVGKLRFE